MISVKWRERGSADYKVSMAHKLTYVAGQDNFYLYDTEDEVQGVIIPARLEVSAIVNAPGDGKEV